VPPEKISVIVRDVQKGRVTQLGFGVSGDVAN
jgi:hypothetical protein